MKLYRDDDCIVVESDVVRVFLDPAKGGRIRSFVSKKTGREHLYTDTRKELSDVSYSSHDISGFTECFPTVAQCTYPDGKREGMDMGDHGWLWRKKWDAEIEGDQVVMCTDLPEWECRIEKVCDLEEPNRLHIAYSIENYADEPLKYIYSAHPLLCAQAGTQFIFPKEMNEAYVYLARGVPGLDDGSWIAWPPCDESGLCGDLSTGRGSVAKLFSPKLEEGVAAVYREDVCEALEFRFDTSVLAYLGVLYSQGFDSRPDGHFRDKLFLALEPTTGIGDDLSTCQANGTVRTIMPQQEVKFWIEMRLISKDG